MKKTFIILATLVLFVLQGCDNSDDPSALETSEQLLAGNVGNSKSWRLISGAAYSEGETVPAEMVFENCFLDNIYTFNNTESQAYTTGEGASKCNTSDPTEIERGFWAFVENREKLLISANDLIHVEQSLFGKFQSPPATVLKLNESEMELEFDYTMTGVPDGRFRFTFEAVD